MAATKVSKTGTSNGIVFITEGFRIASTPRTRVMFVTAEPNKSPYLPG